MKIKISHDEKTGYFLEPSGKECEVSRAVGEWLQYVSDMHGKAQEVMAECFQTED